MATTAPPAESATVDDLALVDAWWRAANYLSVGQIYLLDNPLLRQPLSLDHVKPRLLGHWGTTPGLNLIYAHLNRVILARDLDVIYICGPGHGGPGMVANTYLEGTYSETYPAISQDETACGRCSASSRSRAASPATPRPRPRARYTRAASWATPSPTPTGRRSTTPTSWWRAWSATARPRPARSPGPGTRTSSSTRSPTGRSCRSSTSTGTRSPTPRCSPASPTASWCRCSRATATRSTSWPATTPPRSTGTWPTRSTGRSTRSPPPSAAGGRAATPSGPGGR